MVEKPKRKKREDRHPDKLLFATPFEFISPLPVEECAYRLHEMNRKKTFLLAAKLAISIFSDKEGSYRFYMTETSNTPMGWVIGDLAVHDEVSTRVSGQIGITLAELLPPFIFVPIAFVSLVAVVSNSYNAADVLSFLVLVLSVWLGTFCIGALVSLRYAKRHLTQVLNKKLELRKQKPILSS